MDTTARYGSWAPSMRVLQVLSQKPGFTGSGIYLRALLEESRKSQIDTAAVVGLNKEDSTDIPNCYPVHFESEELPFCVAGMSDVMPYRSSRWSDLTEHQLNLYRRAFRRVLEQAVHEFEPDVIHCHHLWFATAITRELFAHIRVVASSHGTGIRQQEKLPHYKDKLIPWLSEIDHGYFLTPAQLESVSYLKHGASIVGAGFNSSVFHNIGRPERSGFRILYAGKLARAKGVGELLAAASPLLSKDVSLALAGSGHGAEASALEAQAIEIGATLLGRLSQDQLSKEMRASDLFVLPSYYEGLPLVLAEALACGCRVLVTELPGVLSWLPRELQSANWVTLVPLPGLRDSDKPIAEEIPEFVEGLSASIKLHMNSTPSPPVELESFLAQNSWSGVFQKISAHYGSPKS